VCWTTDTAVQRNGGDVALGWTANDEQGATEGDGQWNWRLCAKCHRLVYCPEKPLGRQRPASDTHDPIGWILVLPNNMQGANDSTGQEDWRPCDLCRGLFWAKDGDTSKTLCPATPRLQTGASALLRAHHIPDGSWNFYLPSKEQGAREASGQPEWRLCAECHSPFWDGDSIKGVRPKARGGGLRPQRGPPAQGEYDPGWGV
jgi:hypothetical protein